MCRTQRSQRDEPESSHKLSCYHQTLNKIKKKQNSWYCILVHLHDVWLHRLKDFGYATYTEMLTV